MSIDDFIKKYKVFSEEQIKLRRLCLPEYNCDGMTDCSALKNGKGKGCIKLSNEYDQLVEYLEELKSYREKTGEWQKNGDSDLYKCSECGELSCCKSRFCGDCGVRMVNGE